MSSSLEFPRVPVCGLEITGCTTEDVRDILERAIDGGGEPVTMATVNLDFLRLASEEPEVRAILGSFTHRFADGWPVLALARRAGHELPERVTGADLTPLICRWAQQRGWRLAFIGATPEVRDRLQTQIPERYGDVLAGHWIPDYPGGSPQDLRDPALAGEIRTRGGQILLVALGFPKQEVWIRENLAASGARAAIGVGASLDFLAGAVRRAPPVVQRLKMEWLFRALQEPRRLGRRYWKDLLFYLRARRSTRDPGRSGRPEVAGSGPTSRSGPRRGPLPVRISATMIQGGRGGIYRYVHEVSRRLDSDPSLRLEVECLRGEEELLAVKHIRTVSGWDKGGLPDLLRAQVAVRPPKSGLVHVPSYRRVPFRGGARVIATVHDLAPLHLPEKYGRARYHFLRDFVPIGLRRCAHLFAVSEHTRGEIIEHLGIDGSRITVTPCGIDHEVMKPGDRDTAWARCREWQPDLQREFVLYLSRIEHPGKGHVPLLEAWAILRDRRRDLPQLVFAGQPVERADEVLRRAQELDVKALVTGFVPDELLPDLYRASYAFVFPSRYEGFGIPPVEAMACGAVVATSRRGALAETSGPAAELEPDSPEQMAEVIARLLDDSEERERISTAGRIWARRFDWDTTARLTAGIYHQVAEGLR